MLPDAVLRRAEQLAINYLSDINYYPTLNGNIMFVDSGEYAFYKGKILPGAKGRSNSGRFIDPEMWIIHMYNDYQGNVKYNFGNRKMVQGETKSFNLFKLLYHGTSYYHALYEGKRMSFYDRYRKHWNWNRYGRRGIGAPFTTELEALVKKACEDAIEQATKDFLNGRVGGNPGPDIEGGII
jgi:hypothetical protein